MWSLFKFEVKYYFKSKVELINFSALFLSVILLNPFVEVEHSKISQYVQGGSLWVALILATMLGSATLFQRDHESGRLDSYQLTPVPLEWVIYTKWLVFYLSVTVPLLLIFPVAGLLTGLPVAAWPQMAIGLVSGALPLSLIAALSSVLMARLERAGAWLGLMVLPLAIPVIIFGSSYSMTVGQDTAASLLFLWGFGIFLLPILGIVGASCIRSGN